MTSSPLFFTNKSIIEEELRRLHKNFIIVPVDKASNNFSFICKKFYLKVLMDELGFDPLSTNPVGNITYKPETLSVCDIIDSHNRELKANYDIKVNDECMPLYSWHC